MATLIAPETERAVLGTCLNFIGQKKGWFNRIAMYVNKPEELFADPRNRVIYEEMRTFYDDNTEPTTKQLIDKVNSNSGSLFDDMTSTGDYINSLAMDAGNIYNSTQFDNAVNYLNEKRLKRHQVRGIEKIIADIKEKNDDFSSSDVSKRLNDIVDNTEVIDETKTFGEIYQEVKDRDAPTWRISTDIQRLDQVLGGKGFEAGTLTTIAARPKVGKTVFMNSLMHTVLEHGGIPIALNYETKDIEFLSKMIARHEIYANQTTVTDLNYDQNGHITGSEDSFTWSVIKDYLANDISDDEEPERVEDLTMPRGKGFTKTHKMLIEDGEQWALDQDWYVSFDKKMSMQGIEMLVKKVKEKNVEKPKIVLFVDYVQLQVTNSEKEREQISDLTKFYKRLAGTYNIAVVILAQINREGTDDPQVEHLKSSGSIEQDSDTILILSKAKRAGEELPDHIKINAGTTRLGQGDIFNVFFDHSLNLVTEADTDKEDIENTNINDFTEDGAGYEKKSKRSK